MTTSLKIPVPGSSVSALFPRIEHSLQQSFKKYLSNEQIVGKLKDVLLSLPWVSSS
jgi:hypothetical protein